MAVHIYLLHTYLQKAPSDKLESESPVAKKNTTQLDRSKHKLPLKLPSHHVNGFRSSRKTPTLKVGIVIEGPVSS